MYNVTWFVDGEYSFDELEHDEFVNLMQLDEQGEIEIINFECYGE